MVGFIFEICWKFVFQLFMTAVGIVVLPFVLTRVEEFECEHEESRPNFKFKDKWIDTLFGNREDGVDGDKPYKQKYDNLSLWTRYNWVAFRNPIHNLALKMGVDEKIVSYTWTGNRFTEDKIGHEGYCYSEAKDESGKAYKMLRWCKLWTKDRGIEANFGYKNFNVIDEGRKYTYSFTVSVNPIKKFEKGE